MLKRIDLLTHLETIKAYTTRADKITVCCFEGLRYWTYSGKYCCVRDLISTWLVIDDEINQEWGQKHAPKWVRDKMFEEFFGVRDKVIEDFNDEIPF